MHCAYFSTTSETVSYIEYVWHFPREIRLFGWEVNILKVDRNAWGHKAGWAKAGWFPMDSHVLADMRIRIMMTTTTTTMMLMLCTSGGWAKADFRDEKCENSGRRNYMYLRMQQHQNWMYETCVALSPLVTIPFGSNAAHTMYSNTPLWTVCGYQVPNTTWHAGNKSICLSTYQIKVHGTLALQAHLLCTWAG